MEEKKIENFNEDMFKMEWTWKDKITMPFFRIKNRIKDKIYKLRSKRQRFKRGYADADVWDMDIWFVATVGPMLKQLQKERHGHPGTISDEEWNSILQEMIDCIALMNEDNAQEYLGISSEDFSAESSNKTYDLMETKKNRFFELFSKWFFNLWD